MIDEDFIENLIDNPDESRELLRCSFTYFIKVFHFYIYKQQFLFKDFHKTIISKLEEMVFNKESCRNLAIAICPRVGKSLILKYFIAWTYAVNKDCNNIYTSYSQKLIEKFSGEIKDIIDSRLYSKVFGLKLKKDTQSKSLWQINDGGQLVASPIGGTITGFGYSGNGKQYEGCLILDDPLKADNYKSATERANCIDYYNSTLSSRANNHITACKILIMQRLHQNDLYGWLKENEPDEWDFITLPAIDEKGESIFPEKISLKALELLKEVDFYTYQAQYMQQPIVKGGNVIKTEYFKEYTQLPKLKQVYITSDTALKTKKANDYSVLQCWGKTNFGTNSEYYLIDMIRGKWESPELLKQTLAFYTKMHQLYRCNCLYIEDKASGTGLIQQLKELHIPTKAILPKKDKYSRVEDVLPIIESGFVYLPKEAWWKKDLLNECEAFTSNDSHDHDDIVDTITQALGYEINKRGINVKTTLERMFTKW